MGPIYCPKMSMTNYQSTLRKILQDRRDHSDSGGDKFLTPSENRIRRRSAHSLITTPNTPWQLLLWVRHWTKHSVWIHYIIHGSCLSLSYSWCMIPQRINVHSYKLTKSKDIASQEFSQNVYSSFSLSIVTSKIPCILYCIVLYCIVLR